jgi:hypothetical protein
MTALLGECLEMFDGGGAVCDARQIGVTLRQGFLEARSSSFFRARYALVPHVTRCGLNC